MRPLKWVVIGTLLVVIAGCALRPTLGRSRPDLAALLSFDAPDGPLTFERTYSSGKVGPFIIGDSRSVTRERLSTLPLDDEDKAQLGGKGSTWRVGLPAKSGGYNIYTVHFESERIASVEAFYSVFAGL
jgi:hypothetical protein